MPSRSLHRSAWGARLVILALACAAWSCSRPNPDYCDDDIKCDAPRFCNHIVAAAPRPGRCQMPDCASDSSCGASAPICDAQKKTCGACTEDRDCARFAGNATPGVGGFCVAGACRECKPVAAGPHENSGCKAAAPVCDSGSCRPCALHAECGSEVCAKDNTLSSLPAPNTINQGQCVERSRVVRVAQGAAMGSCVAGAEPTCPAIDGAVALAGPERPYLLLVSYDPNQAPPRLSLDGVGRLAGYNYHVIGPTADRSPATLTTAPPVSLRGQSQAGAPSAALVTGGQQATLEGLVLGAEPQMLSTYGLRCINNSQVTLLRSVVTANSNAGISIESGCKAVVDESWIGVYSPVLMGAQGRANGIQIVVADRGDLLLRSSVVYLSTDGRFTGISVRMSPNLSPGRARLINDTIVSFVGSDNSPTGWLLECDTGAQVALQNSIFLGQVSGTSRNIGQNCLQGGSANALASDDASGEGLGAGWRPVSSADLRRLGSNGTELPDLRLSAMGAERLGGKGSTGADVPTRDLLGQPRARAGATPAIGAVEPTP